LAGGDRARKIGLSARDHASVLRRPRGIAAVLERAAELDGWKRILEGENLIALEKNGASITLEPGGQLELSGAPLRTIHETCSEFQGHLSLMKRVCEPLGIVWLGLGINPIHGVAQIPQMPKQRYRIMRSYLPRRGSLAMEMMHATATVQANFDFESEADMVAKLRMALGVSPIVSAIFANSGLSEGKANGYVSRRLHIWQHTDPDRTGSCRWPSSRLGTAVRRVGARRADVLRGARRALSGSGRTASGASCRKAGAARAPPSTTGLGISPRCSRGAAQARDRGARRRRGAAGSPARCPLSGRAAHDAGAREAAWQLVAGSCRRSARPRAERAARPGRALRGRRVLSWREPAISREGLRRLAHAGRRDPDETAYLDPVSQQLELGVSPGQVVLDRWEGEWARSLDRLIEYARY
jgi:glutamate--cysteine ligase